MIQVEYRGEKNVILKRMLGHAFWAGYATALLVMIVLLFCYENVVGKRGPVKRAFDEVERHDQKAAEDRPLQPDEQSE